MLICAGKTDEIHSWASQPRSGSCLFAVAPGCAPRPSAEPIAIDDNGSRVSGLGGKVVGPMFGASAAMMGDFNAPALFFASAIAAAFLFVGNVVHDRWGI